MLQVLTSKPTPQQVLALHPSPELEARVSDLLKRSKEGTLSRRQEAELERYLMLEHIVRLAKAHAAQRLAQNE
ncbi:MAG TPA: hypothetical protein ENN99_13980 [Chloroflexi bacterium]|nr:hypothetical protein [Chloroflexota bacterium]